MQTHAKVILHVWFVEEQLPWEYNDVARNEKELLQVFFRNVTICISVICQTFSFHPCYIMHSMLLLKTTTLIFHLMSPCEQLPPHELSELLTVSNRMRFNFLSVMIQTWISQQLSSCSFQWHSGCFPVCTSLA